MPEKLLFTNTLAYISNKAGKFYNFVSRQLCYNHKINKYLTCFKFLLRRNTLYYISNKAGKLYNIVTRQLCYNHKTNKIRLVWKNCQGQALQFHL